MNTAANIIKIITARSPSPESYEWPQLQKNALAYVEDKFGHFGEVTLGSRSIQIDAKVQVIDALAGAKVVITFDGEFKEHEEEYLEFNEDEMERRLEAIEPSVFSRYPSGFAFKTTISCYAIGMTTSFTVVHAHRQSRPDQTMLKMQAKIRQALAALSFSSFTAFGAVFSHAVVHNDQFIRFHGRSNGKDIVIERDCVGLPPASAVEYSVFSGVGKDVTTKLRQRLTIRRKRSAQATLVEEIKAIEAAREVKNVTRARAPPSEHLHKLMHFRNSIPPLILERIVKMAEIDGTSIDDYGLDEDPQFSGDSLYINLHLMREVEHMGDMVNLDMTISIKPFTKEARIDMARHLAIDSSMKYTLRCVCNVVPYPMGEGSLSDTMHFDVTGESIQDLSAFRNMFQHIDILIKRAARRLRWH